jgi:DNA-directed RNA polymerase specialized sigma24 family protein
LVDVLRHDDLAWERILIDVLPRLRHHLRRTWHAIGTDVIDDACQDALLALFQRLHVEPIPASPRQAISYLWQAGLNSLRQRARRMRAERQVPLEDHEQQLAAIASHSTAESEVDYLTTLLGDAARPARGRLAVYWDKVVAAAAVMRRLPTTGDLARTCQFSMATASRLHADLLTWLSVGMRCAP